MTAIVIMKAEDSQRLASLHAQAFDLHSQWDEKAFESLLVLGSTLCLGSENKGVLSGLLLIQKAPPDAEILTLATLPSLRRRGVASDLLRAGLQILRQTGAGKIMLDVSEDNSGAIKFYRNHGFEEDGRRKNYYRRENGQRFAAILMSRPVAGQN